MLATVLKASHTLLVEHDLHRAMESAVEILGQGIGLHRVYIVRYRDEADNWSLIHEWTRRFH